MADPNISGGSGKIAQAYGIINGVWQKQPIFLGYSGRVSESYNETHATGGDLIVNSTPVPAGEIHNISFVSFYHNDPTARNVSVYLHDGVAAHQVGFEPALAANTIKFMARGFTLAPGDKIQMIVWSIAAGKSLHCALWGRRIDIDQ